MSKSVTSQPTPITVKAPKITPSRDVLAYVLQFVPFTNFRDTSLSLVPREKRVRYWQHWAIRFGHINLEKMLTILPAELCEYALPRIHKEGVANQAFLWTIQREDVRTLKLWAAGNTTNELLRLLQKADFSSENFVKTALAKATALDNIVPLKLLVGDKRIMKSKKALYHCAAAAVWYRKPEAVKLVIHDPRFDKSDLAGLFKSALANGYADVLQAVLSRKSMTAKEWDPKDRAIADLTSVLMRRDMFRRWDLLETGVNSNSAPKMGQELIKLMRVLQQKGGFVVTHLSLCNIATNNRHPSEMLRLALQFKTANPAANNALLDTACFGGSFEKVEILLEDPRVAPKNWHFVRLCSRGATALVKRLLADNRIDPSQGMPLYRAVANGYRDIVKLLLDDLWVTPSRAHVRVAIFESKLEILEMLLKSPSLQVTREEIEARIKDNRDPKIEKLLQDYLKSIK